MPRFFFKYHECNGNITDDPVGTEAADVAAARGVALDRARAIMAAEVMQGRLCISCWIVITNDAGHYVTTVHFGEALEITGDEEASPGAACSGSRTRDPS